MFVVLALAFTALLTALIGAGLLSNGIPIRTHANTNQLGNFQPHD
jgi:hypothetical protein